MWTGNKGCTVCASASCTAILWLAAGKWLDFKKFCKYQAAGFFSLPVIFSMLLILLLTLDELLFCGFAVSPIDFENGEGILAFAVDVVPSRDESLN